MLHLQKTNKKRLSQRPARIAFKIGFSATPYALAMFSFFFFFLALYFLKEIYLVTVLDAFFFNVNFTLKRILKQINKNIA